MIKVEPSWMRLAEKLKSMDAKRIYVIGGPDSGKSTLSQFLTEELAKEKPTGLVDCDPGQSTLGLPTTVNAGFFSRGASKHSEIFTRFVGDTSPQRRAAALLLAVHRLAMKMREKNADSIVFDSSGFVIGQSAVEFQALLVEMLQPDVVILLARGEELQPLANQIERLGFAEMEKLPVPQAVRFRSMPVRKEAREAKYRSYFKNADVRVIDIKDMVLGGSLPERFTVQSMRGRLLAFCDREKFVIALGIARSVYETDQICICLTPEFDLSKVAFLHFGNVFLTPEFKEERPLKN